MSQERAPAGSSGVFKAIMAGARKVKRALSEPGSEVSELANMIALAFIAGRFGDIYEITTSGFKSRNPREAWESRWAEAVRARGPLTGFQVSHAGAIDLGFVPGLEDVPQDHFEAMVQITFSADALALDDERAFTIAVVLLDDNDATRVGAIHAS